MHLAVDLPTGQASLSVPLIDDLVLVAMETLVDTSDVCLKHSRTDAGTSLEGEEET